MKKKNWRWIYFPHFAWPSPLFSVQPYCDCVSLSSSVFVIHGHLFKYPIICRRWHFTSLVTLHNFPTYSVYALFVWFLAISSPHPPHSASPLLVCGAFVRRMIFQKHKIHSLFNQAYGHKSIMMCKKVAPVKRTSSADKTNGKRWRDRTRNAREWRAGTGRERVWEKQRVCVLRQGIFTWRNYGCHFLLIERYFSIFGFTTQRITNPHTHTHSSQPTSFRFLQRQTRRPFLQRQSRWIAFFI